MPHPNSCTITVDGQSLTGPADQPLIDFLADHQVELPHICYHTTLGAIQSCDSCWVKADGKLVRGCTVRTRDGLAVDIGGDDAKDARREGLDRIVARHELYCSVCDNNNGDCQVHNAVVQAELPFQRYEYQPKPYEVDSSHPFYRYDPDQCILCGRCVEACQEVQVTGTLSIDWASEHPRVLWDGGRDAGDSSCVSCGHCVTVCPCNALMEKSMLGQAGPLTGMPDAVKRPAIDLIKGLEPTLGYEPIIALSEMDSDWREPDISRTKTVCTYCGVGCSFEMWTRGREILKVQPHPEAPVNGISTCVKGKFGWDFVNAPDRLTQPLIRENDAFREATWEEAYALIARRFREIQNETGPDSLAFVASSKCTCEESYLMQKLSRAVMGTNNIDNCSRYCQSPATTGLFRTMGYGGDSGCEEDLKQAELVLFVGSNTAESHPVMATRLRQAQKHNGQKHVVLDIRRHEMAARADLFLQPTPGTDLVCLNTFARYILDHGLQASDFIAEKVNHFDEFRESLAPFTLEYGESVTGIPAERLAEAARMIAEADTVCAVWAMGVTQHMGGSDTSTAIANLLLLTGNGDRRGTGAYPMRGHNNVQGCSDFGSMPDTFPGYQSVDDEAVRAKFADGWGVPLSGNPGMDNHEMVDAIHEGRLRSLYVIGEDMAVVDANALYVQDAFEKLDFFVVQDIFFSRTCEFADVVLPATPSVEKDGTFVNTERRLQRLYEVMPPLGNARPDWRILTELAQHLGAPWHYQHPSEIMDEAASLTPLFAGASYERLAGWRSLQWPISADGTGTEHLYTGGFHFDDGKARFHPVHWQAPDEQPDDEYDLHVNNGRLLESFHEGNLTARSEGLSQLIPGNFVEVSPTLARERGLVDGTRVRLTSRRGSIELPVVVTDRVTGKQVYVPENATRNLRAINVLTSSDVDRDTNTPAYKEVAAKLEVLEPSGPPALPATNPRYHRARPQDGAQAERKWQRPDYVTPPGSANNPEIV
ncbi:formate dehydrogenase subunit alpha [Marinobacter sp. C2H3]|uniref:formate dehydrogenase subunit alpha n=1 Tax=Marinobacter sp. C2H3 TaxID=3119003 RepID=UPI00300F345B